MSSEVEAHLRLVDGVMLPVYDQKAVTDDDLLFDPAQGGPGHRHPDEARNNCVGCGDPTRHFVTGVPGGITVRYLVWAPACPACYARLGLPALRLLGYLTDGGT